VGGGDPRPQHHRRQLRAGASPPRADRGRGGPRRAAAGAGRAAAKRVPHASGWDGAAMVRTARRGPPIRSAPSARRESSIRPGRLPAERPGASAAGRKHAEAATDLAGAWLAVPSPRRRVSKSPRRGLYDGRNAISAWQPSNDVRAGGPHGLLRLPSCKLHPRRRRPRLWRRRHGMGPAG